MELRSDILVITSHGLKGDDVLDKEKREGVVDTLLQTIIELSPADIMKYFTRIVRTYPGKKPKTGGGAVPIKVYLH